jgi:signal transduction histidine kinase
MAATAERLPAKYLVKEEAPTIISSPEQHQTYISRLLELKRKAHRSAEKKETAKLLVVLIADYEEAAKRSCGLGLISMQERLRLVGGEPSVEFEPTHGTRIPARIPAPPSRSVC